MRESLLYGYRLHSPSRLDLSPNLKRWTLSLKRTPLLKTIHSFSLTTGNTRMPMGVKITRWVPTIITLRLGGFGWHKFNSISLLGLNRWTVWRYDGERVECNWVLILRPRSPLKKIKKTMTGRKLRVKSGSTHSFHSDDYNK